MPKTRQTVKNQINVKKIDRGAAVAVGDKSVANATNTTMIPKPVWVTIIVALISAAGYIIAELIKQRNVCVVFNKTENSAKNLLVADTTTEDAAAAEK